MSKLVDADPNMTVSVKADALPYMDVRKTEARIYGLPDNEYVRLPAAQRALASNKLLYLQSHTSGGRVRFLTNAKKLGIRMRVSNTDLIYNFSYIGYAGMDCYCGGRDPLRSLGVCVPPLYGTLAQTQLELSGESQLITLYLPLYDGVERLELAVEPGAYIRTPPPYTYETPIIFYGSSITQGGCASKAGNSYCALVSRWLDSDFICMGFSGCAKGELWMADYLASLPMSCFVYDYDYNAPDPEYLRKTHRPFLEAILNKQSDLPVIIMSKPNPQPGTPDDDRREIIRETYLWAKSRGSRVWFLDGAALLGTKGYECCTVDGIHPNDLGFYRMAEAIFPVLQEALGLNRP